MARKPHEPTSRVTIEAWCEREQASLSSLYLSILHSTAPEILVSKGTVSSTRTMEVGLHKTMSGHWSVRVINGLKEAVNMSRKVDCHLKA